MRWRKMSDSLRRLLSSYDPAIVLQKFDEYRDKLEQRIREELTRRGYEVRRVSIYVVREDDISMDVNIEVVIVLREAGSVDRSEIARLCLEHLDDVKDEKKLSDEEAQQWYEKCIAEEIEVLQGEYGSPPFTLVYRSSGFEAEVDGIIDGEGQEVRYLDVAIVRYKQGFVKRGLYTMTRKEMEDRIRVQTINVVNFVERFIKAVKVLME